MNVDIAFAFLRDRIVTAKTECTHEQTSSSSSSGLKNVEQKTSLSNTVFLTSLIPHVVVSFRRQQRIEQKNPSHSCCAHRVTQTNTRSENASLDVQEKHDLKTTNQNFEGKTRDKEKKSRKFPLPLSSKS